MELKQIRNLVFWSFVVLYLIIAPIVSLQALGFVFEPKSFSFVKTGIITINAQPKDARVRLNGHFYASRMPVAIPALRAGRYHVEVSYPGYQTWDRELDVQAEEVTRAERILLVPEIPKSNLPIPMPVQALAPSADGKYLLLVSPLDGALAVDAFDLKKKQVSELLVWEERHAERTFSFTLTTSSDERRALACFRRTSGETCVVSNLAETETGENKTRVLRDSMSNIRFHPKNSKELFYLEDGALRHLDLESGKDKKILDGVRHFEAMEDKLYYLASDFRLFSSDLDGKNVIDLLPDRALKRLLFGDGTKGSCSMFMTGKGNAFWLRGDGLLFMNRLPYFADEEVRGARLAAGSDMLIYWKEKEVWLLDLRQLGEKKESFFEEGPKKTLLWRSEAAIVGAQLVRGESHVVVATQNALVLVEALAPVAGNSFVIASHKMGKDITFYLDDDSGLLYWADRGSEGEPELRSTKLYEPSLFSFSLLLRRSYTSPREIPL